MNTIMLDQNYNYCKKQWIDFTTLTITEEENLCKLMLKMQKNCKKYKIRNVYTGQIFKTASEAARFYKVSPTAIIRGLKRNNGKHLLKQGVFLERI